LSDLPANWRRYPAPAALGKLGTDWALANASLVLRVPSAVVQGEFNFLLNPDHPEMRRVKIIEVAHFGFDTRHVGKRKKM